MNEPRPSSVVPSCALSPGMARLSRDAVALRPIYPAPVRLKEPTWHPAPWTISAAAQQFGERIPPFA